MRGYNRLVTVIDNLAREIHAGQIGRHSHALQGDGRVLHSIAAGEGYVDQARRNRDAVAQVRRLLGQKVATAQMKARSLELEHREQWLEKTFEAAAKRLQEVPRRKDYATIAAQLAREAILQLKSPAVELRMDEVTRGAIAKETIEALAKETGTKLSIGKALDSGTGVFAVTADGRLHFDNTLETRLQRMQGSIRSSVHRVLLGESA